MCFLDIGYDSFFRFMFLDFGQENGWTKSNFVLIDGQFASFQLSDFNSNANVNFKWLSDQNITVNLPATTTSTGLIIFNSASNVDFYFHDSKMKGLSPYDFK